MAREINLVPSIKFETIKALKLRNFILFLCIVVSAGAGFCVFILGTILGGQSLALEGKDKMLGLYSQKIMGYDDLTDFLTIKDQLGKLSLLADNRNTMSRIFNALPVLVPTNGDTVNFSSVTLDIQEDYVLSIEGQANAMNEPYIDYNVLDAFKKSMDYMRYDYGRYVNEYGDEIPAYCIIETTDNGATYFSEDNKFYAYWTAKVDGCDPRHPVDLLQEEEYDEDGNLIEDDSYDEDEMIYEFEDYNGKEVVKIWRTPKFEEWYEDEHMDLSGSISGVPHFESSCIKYDGIEDSFGKPHFSENNEQCSLVLDGVNGFEIIESSNARSIDDDLVLSFNVNIKFDPEYFKMRNYHMMALGPSGHINVTDSYTQIQSLFVAPAVECDVDDLACKGGK